MRELLEDDTVFFAPFFLSAGRDPASTGDSLDRLLVLVSSRETRPQKSPIEPHTFNHFSFICVIEHHNNFKMDDLNYLNCTVHLYPNQLSMKFVFYI
jgi:hypothetical protein